jgi:adenylate kinase
MLNRQSPDPVPGTLHDLEIKDGRLIFESVWQDLEAEFGREHLRFPKEIILLGGAPGAGKGTHTAFIAKTRSFTRADRDERVARSPEARALRTRAIWSAIVKP